MVTINEQNEIREAIHDVRTHAWLERRQRFIFRHKEFFVVWEPTYYGVYIQDEHHEKIFSANAEFINDDTLARIFANFLEYYDHSGKMMHALVHRKDSGKTSPVGYNSFHYPNATANYSSLEERVKKLEEKVVKSEKFFDTVKGVEKAMDDIWGIIDKWEDMDRNPYMASSGMDAIKEILDNLED